MSIMSMQTTCTQLSQDIVGLIESHSVIAHKQYLGQYAWPKYWLNMTKKPQKTNLTISWISYGT